MTGTPILVTGGAGYVGAHTCKALGAAGWLPVTYDNLGQGHAEAVRWGPLEHGDIADRERLDVVLDSYRPVAVLHFAAFTSVAESVADPEKYRRNNVGGSRILLEAIRDHGIDRFVFSSSAAVYGVPETIPIPEDSPKSPVSPYGATKLATEAHLAAFARAHGLNATALRYFNAAGADPDGEIGERHDPETHLIPLALDAAAGKGPPLKLFGDDYPTEDGTCVRDYIHVSDLADAHVKAIDTVSGFSAYNLGTGKGASVREILDTVERVTGRAVPHDVAPRREGDPAALVADPSRAMAELAWTPRISDLETIVSTAWAWHRRG